MLTASMEPVPPSLSNVILTLGIGLAFHFAVTVTLSLATISSPGFLSTTCAEPITTDHLSNTLSAGGVNVHSGNL